MEAVGALKERVAVVTGAAGDLGRAIVLGLVEAGFFVSACDLSRQSLEVLQSELAEHGDRLEIVEMDVTDPKSVEAAASWIGREKRDVSVLINNAGVFEECSILLPGSAAVASRVVQVNLLGVFHCVSSFSSLMLRHRYGRVINVASAAAWHGFSSASAYAASKAGGIAATQAWARELGPFGISVVAVAPGIFHSRMQEEYFRRHPEEDKLIRSMIPVRRYGEPRELAELVVFLSTCRTDYLNGSVIPMEGGF